MYTENIQLSTVEHVKKFVTAISFLDFQVDIYQDKYCVNGKSIMGIFSLDLTKNLVVSAEVEGADLEKLKEAIKEFVV